MSSSQQSTSTGGIGFGGALFLVFLVLKLTGVIAWSWWWVTAPLWIPFVIVAVLALIAAVLVGVSATRTKARRRARNR